MSKEQVSQEKDMSTKKTQEEKLISEQQLERMMQIAYDVRKAFSYSRSSGMWSWYDRNEPEFISEDEFPTFLDALKDAISPYEDSEE